MRARLAPITALVLVACTPGGPTPTPSASGTPYVLKTATPDPTPTPTPVPSPVQATFPFSGFTATVDGQPAGIAPQAFRSLEGDTEYVTIGMLGPNQVLDKGRYQLKLVLDGRGRSPVAEDFPENGLKGGFTLVAGNGSAVPDEFGSAENPEDKHFTVKGGKLTLHFKGRVNPFLGGQTHQVEVTVTDLPMR